MEATKCSIDNSEAYVTIGYAFRCINMRLQPGLCPGPHLGPFCGCLPAPSQDTSVWHIISRPRVIVYSACAVTLVAFGHCNRPCYLLRLRSHRHECEYESESGQTRTSVCVNAPLRSQSAHRLHYWGLLRASEEVCHGPWFFIIYWSLKCRLLFNWTSWTPHICFFFLKTLKHLVFVLSGELVNALVWVAIILPAVYVYFIFYLCATICLVNKVEYICNIFESYVTYRRTSWRLKRVLNGMSDDRFFVGRFHWQTKLANFIDRLTSPLDVMK